MNYSNYDRPQGVYRKRRQRMPIALKYLLVVVVISLLVLELVGRLDLIPFVGVEDNGPIALATGPRESEIEAVDFRCDAAVTSAFVAQAYDPGWHIFGFEAVTFSNQGVRMQIVGDFDVCVWAEDTTIEVDDKTLKVNIKAIDANRPRIDHQPRTLDNQPVQTGLMVVDTHFTKRNKDKSAIELQELILRFSQSVLLDSNCLDDVYDVVVDGITRHYLAEAIRHGLELDIHFEPSRLDFDTVEIKADSEVDLSVSVAEKCHVQAWGATG